MKGERKEERREGKKGKGEKERGKERKGEGKNFHSRARTLTHSTANCLQLSPEVESHAHTNI